MLWLRSATLMCVAESSRWQLCIRSTSRADEIAWGHLSSLLSLGLERGPHWLLGVQVLPVTKLEFTGIDDCT